MTHISIEVDDELIAIVQRMAKKREATFEQTLNFLLERMLVGIPRKILPLISDYKPQHIPIMLDPTEDKQKKAFRCVTCGCAVFNYYGSVKLITNGTYDANQNLVDGEDVDWFSKTGVPDEIICPGRVILQLPDGRTAKRRCSTVFYRIGV